MYSGYHETPGASNQTDKPRQSQVQEELDILDKCLSELEATTTDLAKHLEPVLQHDPQPDTVNEKIPMPIIVPIAEKIRLERLHVQDLIIKIKLIIQGLEI